MPRLPRSMMTLLSPSLSYLCRGIPPRVQLGPGLRRVRCLGQRLCLGSNNISCAVGLHSLGGQGLQSMSGETVCSSHSIYEQLGRLASQGLQQVLLGVLLFLGTVHGEGMETATPVILQKGVQVIHHLAIQQSPVQ